MRIQTSGIVLFLIITAGAVFRLINLGETSLSNDELSALSRLQVNSLKELMETGVRPDFHPAGVQLFLYCWTSIGNTDVLWVRLPFAFAGMASIFLIYLIGKSWFGRNAGLMAAAFMSFTAFPLLYSQLARPYAPGLMFSLAMVLCLTNLSRLRYDNRSGIYLNATGYGLFTLACMYTHYFSFLFAIIAGITGLVIIRGTALRYFIIAAAGAVLFFLPHLGITLEHMSRGGLSTWLGKPDHDSLIQLIHYMFNGQWWLLCITVLIAILGKGPSGLNRSGYRIIAVIWFMVPWIIAHFYSLWVNPVFQFSVMIFSFSYLPLFVFSWMKDEMGRRPIILVTVFSVILAYSTFAVGNYYNTRHFGEFRALAENIRQWHQQFGENKITHSININNPFYIHYYLPDSLDFETYQVNADGQSLAAFEQIVAGSTTPYYVHGWSTRYNPYETDVLIRRYFPYVIERRDYFNSGITLYAKYGPGSMKDPVALFVRTKDFADEAEDSLSKGSRVFRLDSHHIYSPAIQLTVEEAFGDSAGLLSLTARLQPQADAQVSLVISLERDEGNFLWYGLDAEPFFETGQEWQDVVMIRELPAGELRPGDIIKAYVWHRGGGAVLADKIELKGWSLTHSGFRRVKATGK